MQIDVPVGPTKPRQLVPLLQWLTNEVVDIAGDRVAAEGKSISCRAGCGACCRQLVPIAPAEAHRIAELVERLPEPRRGEVLRRFEKVEERLADTGLLERLAEPQSMAEGELHAMGIEYFRLGIPCPFLEDESCSIHPDRPLSCREYLVTSPAENCRRPTAETVEKVTLPVKISSALLRLDRVGGDGRVPWAPLSLAPRWAQRHPEPPPRRTGPQLLDEVFSHVRGAR